MKTIETLLRDADPARDLPEYSATQRSALLERAVTAAPARRRPALRLATVAAATALVAGLGYTGVAGNIATARAQEVLETAAINATDEPAKPGQWWELTTTGTSTVSAYDGHNNRLCVVNVTWVDYVAVDGNRPSWFVREPARPAAKQVMANNGCDALSGRRDVWTTNLAPNQVPASWQSPNAAFLRDLPRDVSALRERLFVDATGHGDDPDASAFTYATDLLRSGIVPADLRSALFDVLKSVDRIQVVEDTTVDGRPAVVLGIRNLFGYVSRVIVDPSNGTVLGEVSEFSLVPVVGPNVTKQTSTRRVLVDDIRADVRAAAVKHACTVTDSGAQECEG